MPLSLYMDPRLVMFLETKTRDEVLNQMVHRLYEVGKLENEQDFYHAILEREKIVSTDIGMGIAIPHAKLSSFNQFIIAIGILQKPVDWDSLDHSLVRLVFMIGGPDDKQTEYLQILSGLTQVVKDDETRKKILTGHSPHDVIHLFEKSSET